MTTQQIRELWARKLDPATLRASEAHERSALRMLGWLVKRGIVRVAR